MSASEIVRKTLLNFGSETSLAGINNSGKRKSKIRSAIWLLIFFILAYLTGVNIYNIVNDYLKYPVVTSTDISHQTRITFPAVTICNLNRVSCHNTFQTMLHINNQLLNPDTTLSPEERQELNQTLDLINDLVSKNVSDCKSHFCDYLKTSVSFPLNIMNNKVDFLQRSTL